MIIIPHAKLIEVGLSRYDCASIFKLAHHRGREGAHKPFEDIRAACCRRICRANVVLDSNELAFYR